MKYPIEIACIIDDDNMYVSLLTKIIDLRELAKSLLIFRNGKEALDYFVSIFEKVEERPMPQVILLDLNMPVMDGWEFLSELTNYDFPAFHNTTLYIVSSSINPVDLNRAKEIQLVKDFIIKPIAPNEIATIFRKEAI